MTISIKNKTAIMWMPEKPLPFISTMIMVPTKLVIMITNVLMNITDKMQKLRTMIKKIIY